MSRLWNNYWHEYTISRERLATLRVIFYGLLTVDLWKEMIVHAYRPGLGGFNVSHISSLDPWLPLPSASVFVLGYLCAGFFAATIALGLPGRLPRIALATIYSSLYLWSQQDAYQHHYLLGLLLVIGCFVPWDRKAPGEAVKSWAVRLLYVQIAIVYAYAAVTKMDTHWVNGWALQAQIGSTRPGLWFSNLAAGAGMEALTFFALASWLVLLWEVLVAVAFLARPLYIVALCTGPIFHISVEVFGFEIYFFSFYMVGLYIALTTPERWLQWLYRPFGRLRDRLNARFDILRLPPGRLLPILLGTLGAGLVGLSQPYPRASLLGLLFAAFVLLREWKSSATSVHDTWRRILLQMAALALLILITRPVGTAYEYWRLAGGDFRRRGNLEAAAEAYEHAVALARKAPSRERQLATIYLQLNRHRDALQMYQRALQADPDDLESQTMIRLLNEYLEREASPSDPEALQP